MKELRRVQRQLEGTNTFLKKFLLNTSAKTLFNQDRFSLAEINDMEYKTITVICYKLEMFVFCNPQHSSRSITSADPLREHRQITAP